MSIFLVELSLCCSDEVVINFVFNEVDGATTEATTHDTATCDTIFLCQVVEIVKFFAAYFIFLAKTIVCFEHLLTYSLVVTLFKSIADCQYTVFLAQYKVSAAVILFANFCTNLFQLLPCAITEGFELSLWMFSGDVFNHILTRVATVVVWRTSQLMLYLRVYQAELVALRVEWEVLKLAAV